MKLTTLGCMGWIPTRNRQTCCYCLELDDCDTLIVFDAGSGLARFVEPWAQAILDKYSNVLLLLSHYHLDHVTGLGYLSFVFKNKKVRIAAPGLDLYGRSALEILSGFITPPVFGRAINDQSLDLEIQDLLPGHNRIAGLDIETVRQKHSDPSLGIKVAGQVCYITDTTITDKTVGFVSSCRLLLHECWLDKDDYIGLKVESESSVWARKTLSSHSAAPKVAGIAVEAGVEELLLIHLNPAYDDVRLKQMEKDTQGIFKNCRMAKDGENNQVKAEAC